MVLREGKGKEGMGLLGCEGEVCHSEAMTILWERPQSYADRENLHLQATSPATLSAERLSEGLPLQRMGPNSLFAGFEDAPTTKCLTLH